MTAIGAIREGYVALVGGTAYTGRLPPDQAVLPCAVLRVYAGRSNVYLPLRELHVQVCCYSTSQAQAAENAEGAYAALHQKGEWVLTGWVALDVEALNPPIWLPELPYQGADLHRWAFNARFILRKAV